MTVVETVVAFLPVQQAVMEMVKTNKSIIGKQQKQQLSWW